MRDPAEERLRVVFFANVNSVHVHRWLSLLKECDVEVDGWTVEPIDHLACGRWRTVGMGLGALRYLTAGMWARLTMRGRGIVHAHNASGYGVMAYCAGMPYIVTTYGSEILQAKERSVFYRWALRRVVQSAVWVTCTSESMQRTLSEEFGVPLDRIRLFSLGIPVGEYVGCKSAREAARRETGLGQHIVITSIRRMHPLYRIDAVVEAFVLLCRGSDRYRLVLFEGDSDAAYAESIRALVDKRGIAGRVVTLPGIQPKAVIRQYLMASDVVVSVPISDQMSASMLEALACGCVIVAADLPAYRALFERGFARVANLASIHAFAESLRAGAAVRKSETGREVIRYLQQEHSNAVAQREIAALYEHTPVD